MLNCARGQLLMSAYSVKRNASSSPFLRLPGEVRNKIYGYVMEDLVLVVHKYCEDKVIPCAKQPSVAKRVFLLPQVCRQLYSETFVLLFKKATILFSFYASGYEVFDCNGIIRERNPSKDPQVLHKSRLDVITSVTLNPDSALMQGSLFPNLQQLDVSAEGCGSSLTLLKRDLLEKWHGHVQIHFHDNDPTGGLLNETNSNHPSWDNFWFEFWRQH